MKQNRKEKGNVPNLRFNEFNGEWEEKKLGEVATFSKGKGISKSDIVEDGITECIRYGELYTYYGEVINEIKSKTNVDKSTLILSEVNDVIIPASGETTIDIATASCVLKFGVLLGGDLNIIKTQNNGVFLSYYLNSKKKLEIANLAQGISVVHLYSSQLASLSLNFPKLEEQNKISTFLALIDERIQTQNKIIEGLESLIKSLNNKLLSCGLNKLPSLRFSEFLKKWEIVSLKDIAVKINAKNRENEVNIVFSNSATQGIVLQNEYFDKNIANKENLHEYYIVAPDDFVYNPRLSLNAEVGAMSVNHTKLTGLVSPLYTVFRIKNNNINIAFLESIFESKVWHNYMRSIANYGARDDRMNIRNDDFFDLPLYIPKKLEQQKIADFLTVFNNRIETEKNILRKYKEQKKYLLHNLFI